MSTPAERRALLFLSAVALLGAGVRVVRSAGAREPVPPAAERALTAQRSAVDEAAQARAQPPARRRAAGSARGSRGASRPAPTSRLPRGRRPTGRPSAAARDRAGAAEVPGAPVDVDRASAAELERLPRIGPALARRIVADRDSLGPFGSLDGLRRVKGIGAAVAAALARHVTFSGTPRPMSAERAGRRRRP